MDVVKDRVRSPDAKHGVSSTVDERPAQYASSTVKGMAAQYASSIVVQGAIDPRVRGIDRKRQDAGLSHGELCRRAGIHPPTWLKLRKGERAPLQRTIDRLDRALAGDDIADRLPLIASVHRLTMILLARESGDDVAAIMRQDFSVERPQSPLWLRAAHLRRYAMYLVATELDVGNAAIGRAIGCARQNVQQARQFTDRAMDDDATRQLIERCAVLISGRAP